MNKLQDEFLYLWSDDVWATGGFTAATGIYDEYITISSGTVDVNNKYPGTIGCGSRIFN